MAEAERASVHKWIFSQQDLSRTPSIRAAMSYEQELRLRQQAAGFIQEMGEKLNHNVKDARARLSQLCMCAAMIHMHRFYVFHSFAVFDGRDISAASLFLAGKSEECPRKLEHIVRVWYMLKFPKEPQLDPKSEKYIDASQYIVTLENILLQTIAFDMVVEVPHPHVLKAVQKIFKGQKVLAETAYYFASDILHLTNYCVRYRAATIACVCINMACVWADCEIPHSQDNKPWYFYVDPHVGEQTLDELTTEFGKIYTENKDRLNIRRHGFLKRQQQPHDAGAPSTSNATPNTHTGVPPGPSMLPPPPPPPSVLHDPATKAPALGSPLKRVKTEPAVLDLNKYKERRADAPTHTNPPPPSAPRKSFIPDTSAETMKKIQHDDERRRHREKEMSRNHKQHPPQPLFGPDSKSSHSRPPERKRPASPSRGGGEKHRRTEDRHRDRERRHEKDRHRDKRTETERRSSNQPMPHPRHDAALSEQILNDLGSPSSQAKAAAVATHKKVFDTQKQLNAAGHFGSTQTTQASHMQRMREQLLVGHSSKVKVEPNGVNAKSSSNTPKEDLEEGEIPDPPLPKERPPPPPPS